MAASAIISPMNAFQHRIRAAQRERKTSLCLSLDIVIADTPLPILPADEPMLPFARDIIEATADLVCAYQIRPTYFLAEGGSGMIALERIVRLIPESTPLIIDLRLDDVNEAALAARAAFYQYKGSAVTARRELTEATARAIAGYDRGGQGVLAVLDGAPVALPGAWHGYSIEAARTAEAAEARRLNPDVIALLQHADALDSPATRALSGPGTVFVVDRSVLYASRRMTFAEDARASALRQRERLAAT
jgi:orotidine-5'-phosphate decarboxylase